MRSPLITVMSNAALKASKVLLRDFGEVDQLQVSRKGTANFVTKTDLKVEKILHTELKIARPDYGFLMEEGGERKGPDTAYRWIIDPIDGTSNFIHAVPYFCISIALEQTIKAGLTDIVAGVIMDAIHNELFWAEKYKGAFLNDRRLAVSGRGTLAEAMIVTGNPRYSASDPQPFAMLKAAAESDAVVRTTGASALDLAYLAAGRYDACWYSALQPWDMAAGMLLVTEAGGLVTQIDGSPASPYSPTLLAANQPLHPKMIKLLAGSGTDH